MKDDLSSVMKTHEDSLIITIEKVIINNTSSVDLIYYDTFIKMDHKTKELSPLKEIIYGFTKTVVPVVGVITLKTSIGSKKVWVRHTTKFIVWKSSLLSTQYSGNCSSTTFELCPLHTIIV